MDSSRRRRPKSVDGFVSSKLNSPLANPFEKIINAKLGSTTGTIPHRKSTPLGGFNRQTSNRLNKPDAARISPTLNQGIVTSNFMAEQNPEIKKISRRERHQNEQLAKVHKKKRLKRILKLVAAIIVTLFLVIGGYLGFKFFHNIDKVFGGNIISNISGLFSSTTLKGEASGRVNILLAGDSADQLNHGGAQLTDSIVIISINTQNNTAFMLSIPRDFWVNIPGMGWEKINAANDNVGTHFPGYPQNGMGILEHIITTDLGIPIDYYALSDYGAFRDSVNAVGGVTVNIQSPDPRGLYDPYTNLKLPNGLANLNGQEALNLARARGDGPGAYGFPSSDFDRTAHQREIFTALAAKAKTIGVLANPVKIGSLFDALGNNVQTDLSLPDILQLVKISKNINLSNVQSFAFCSTLTLGQNGCNKAILTGYVDPMSGQDALVPTAGIGNYSQMTQYYNQLISSNPLARENANIIIENGSNTSGIAGAYQTKINNNGGNVTSISNASSIYNTTEIVDNSFDKFPATKTYLEAMFGNKVVSSNTTLNPTGADFVVIIGNNQKLPAVK